MTILTTPGLAESIEKGWGTRTLAAIDHPIEAVIETWPDGVIRLWDGIGLLRYAGADWRGIGPFGRVAGIGGSKRLLLRTVTFEMSGIPAVHAIYLDPLLRNRPAMAWTAWMNERGTKVNGEPYQEVDGLVDYQTHTADDSGVQTIALSIGEPVYSIERAQNLSYTPEWANTYLEGWRERNRGGARITGYDRIAELADATRSWTRT
jgi:hypothetical protein